MAFATVGCKLPNGMILHMADRDPVTLKGANSSAVVGGFGITTGVDASFMDAWLEKHKDLAPVKGGFVFTMEKKNDAEAYAKEMGGLKTGMEPLDPQKPPPGVEETEESRKARGAKK